MTGSDTPPLASIDWRGAVRIIRSIYPPIDLFEDIADPADWPLLISAEQKTNPRIMETIGKLDLVPPARRVSGPGASFLMAPFTHVSPDRPSRFSDGRFGVLYVAASFETALFETIHHHARFMAATGEPAGWTSQFREIVLDVKAELHDLRGGGFDAALAPDNYAEAQALALALRAAGSEGIAYPSVRHPGGECAGLFYPDSAASPVQGRHIDYHWNGERVDFYRDAGSGAVFRIV
ncbi:RES family NAD+ phosphorylase [Nitratireductor aquibiodomus]|uniref:RES family NAD+ phosphorylase n=1 Tax=Nitratireductor aquibiodomus TaxID=204799 RepID=UPI0004684FC9|nr:RES family NAD+ phosphorylase [Nitratireductor aquibiodomus]